MPIQLDKILSDIARENALHPNYLGASKKEIDDAWARVSKNYGLSVHESRSIFKVLQKKYEQEKLKESSTWKLFGIMDKIHQKIEIKLDAKEDDHNLPIEEDEEYEMLEVQEEEEITGSILPTIETTSEMDISNTLVEKDERVRNKSLANQNRSTTFSQAEHQIQSTKLLNSLASSAHQNINMSTHKQSTLSYAKKGVSMRKNMITSNNQSQTNRSMMNLPGKTIQLPDSLKRKLCEDQQSAKLNHLQMSQSQMNKTQIGQVSTITSPQLIQIKQEIEDDTAHAVSASYMSASKTDNASSTTSGINLITIPANTNASALVNGLITTMGGPSSSTAATIASTSTNGFSPRLEEIDFRNDIIFDTTTANGANLSNKMSNTSEIINLGNFDNLLPPTFFKNLCNSSRHEALGLYVANVMNRLRPRSAAKLELGILRAIIDTQCEEFEQ